MNGAPREEIYAALFAKLSALVPTLATVSRRLKHIEDVQPSEFPAGYQVQQDEAVRGVPRMPNVWTFRAEWWIYTYEPDYTLPPSTKLNPILDAVANALSTEAGVELNTLGGRVYNAQIEGNIEIVEGVLGDRALAIIPIRILKAD